MNAFPKSYIDMISVFPNIMFALIYQMNFFSIYKGLKKATDKRMNVVTGYGMTFCIIIYILIGIMGYCLFGHN
jgi:amino acid permease